jgi:hypothetical protein
MVQNSALKELKANLPKIQVAPTDGQPIAAEPMWSRSPHCHGEKDSLDLLA